MSIDTDYDGDKCFPRISYGAAPTRTQGAEQCINCGMATDPKCACSRGRALSAAADDAQPVAIYQFFVATQGWIDISKESYDTAERVKAEGKRRIVYATRDAAPIEVPPLKCPTCGHKWHYGPCVNLHPDMEPKS